MCRKPKPEQRLRPTLKYYHAKIKDFRSQRTGCKPLTFSSLGPLFCYTTTSGNGIPMRAEENPFPGQDNTVKMTEMDVVTQTQPQPFWCQESRKQWPLASVCTDLDWMKVPLLKNVILPLLREWCHWQPTPANWPKQQNTWNLIKKVQSYEESNTVKNLDVKVA